MFNHQPELFPSNETTFSKICVFAENGNVVALRHLFSNGVSVNLHNSKCQTAVMILAEKGNATAMWLLIDTFNASPNHALQGAAFANRQDLVEALLARGAKIEYALSGYGLNDNVANIEKILKATPWYELLAKRDVALQALARGGHLAKMKQLHKEWHQTISFEYDYDSMPTAAVQGLSYAGNDADVQTIIKENPSLLHAEVEGHAEAGRIERVNALLKSEDRSLRRSAIVGYIHAGLSEQALKLIDGINDKYFIAGRFAAIGKIDEVEKILSEVGSKRYQSYELPFENAAIGFCENGDITRGFDVVERFGDVEKVTKSDNKRECYDLTLCVSRMLSSIPSHYKLADEATLIKVLAFINSPLLREIALNKHSGHLLTPITDDKKQQILAQAKNVNCLMKLETNFEKISEYIMPQTTPGLSSNLGLTP